MRDLEKFVAFFEVFEFGGDEIKIDDNDEIIMMLSKRLSYL